jgi:hypothetical protein
MMIRGVNEEESTTRRFESSEGGIGARCGDSGQNRYQQRRPCCGRRTMKELGRLIGQKAEPLGRLGRKSKEDVFGPQREAGPKALDPFFFSNWNKSFEFKIKGFEYFQINFQMKSGLEPN